MNIFENRFLNRVLHKTLWAAVLPLCALAGVAQVATNAQREADAGALATAAHSPSRAQDERLSQWHGVPLRPLALSDVELRFAKHFPGTITRMTDDRQTLVLRTVNKPTRMLHPATDCYRGLGYRIVNEQLEVQASAGEDASADVLWRCFVAQRHGRSVRVCERIEDATGQGFTDTSSWYWASIAGQSQGPWTAVTVATPL